VLGVKENWYSKSLTGLAKGGVQGKCCIRNSCGALEFERWVRKRNVNVGRKEALGILGGRVG